MNNRESSGSSKGRSRLRTILTCLWVIDCPSETWKHAVDQCRWGHGPLCDKNKMVNWSAPFSFSAIQPFSISAFTHNFQHFSISVFSFSPWTFEPAPSGAFEPLNLLFPPLMMEMNKKTWNSASVTLTCISFSAFQHFSISAFLFSFSLQLFHSRFLSRPSSAILSP